MENKVLEIGDLNAYYGESHILHGVSLEVRRGELVTLLGRNGAGRTTLLKSILGLTGQRSGSIRIDGVETMGLATHQVARLGIGYCPEERGIFSSLTAEENLLLPPVLAAGTDGRMSLAEIYALFPNLERRRTAPGTKLSGGEQQMLALARVLRTGAKLLLLDEISEGLAPLIVQEMFRALRSLKQRGYTVLLVEQNFSFASGLADRFYVMAHGQVVEHFNAAMVAEKTPLLHELLGV
jgi:branched-chain amino acid transport system ATP-binding protein